jgi:hypothetical protein
MNFITINVLNTCACFQVNKDIAFKIRVLQAMNLPPKYVKVICFFNSCTLNSALFKNLGKKISFQYQIIAKNTIIY